MNEPWSAILESTIDPIVVADESGTIQSASRSVSSVFGWQPEELIGQKFTHLMCSPFAEEYAEHLQAYLRSGREQLSGQTREVLGRRKDGTSFPAELSVSVARAGGES